MTEISEVKTIGEVERIVHGSDMWDGTDPVEFSDDGVTWTEAWEPSMTLIDRTSAGPGAGLLEVKHDHPTFARVTVYRKGVRVGTRVTIRWDEQRPRENEEWAAKWDAAPTRHFGRTARMVAFRQTFRDILGDIQLEDEERGKTEPPVEPERDWVREFALARTVEEINEVHAAAMAVRAYKPEKSAGLDIARRNRIRQLQDPERTFTGLAAEVVAEMDAIRQEFDDAWKPAPGPSPDVQGPATPERLAELNASIRRPQDHLPGNRAERRARTKKKGRR